MQGGRAAALGVAVAGGAGRRAAALRRARPQHACRGSLATLDQPAASSLAAAPLACGQQQRGFASRMHFEGFPFGGFPGGGGPQGNNDKFYELLGVAKDADETQIKQAYKKKAMELHPDRGGDEAAFKEVSKAYEVLSDQEKRQLYDQLGEEGLDQMGQGGGPGGAPGGVDPFDLFSSIFGFNAAAGGRRSQRGRPVTQDSVYELQVSLEDLYSGARRDIVFNRDALCSTCNGKGGTNVQQCRPCNGTGVVVTLQQLGVMVQQIQRPCNACAGKGHTIPADCLCEACQGKRVNKQKTTFGIDVERGCLDGTEFRFRGQADEQPDHDPGDVVIVVREKAHKTFQRVKDSLLMSKTISLHEALCGFQFTTTFLDGEDLVIKSGAGQVVKPGDVMVVKGKGMPRPHGQKPGDLLLHLDIDFPTSIPDDGRTKLLEALGGEPLPEPPADACDATVLTKRQAEALKQRFAEASRQQQQSSRGGGDVGCQQQ